MILDNRLANKKGIHIISILFVSDASVKRNNVAVIIPIIKFPINGNFLKNLVYKIDNGNMNIIAIILPRGYM